jgi:acid stress-induced BolA-like protein IbaG/YrbA
MQIDEIKKMIEAGMPDSQVSVTGDGSHFEAVVISDVFEGKGMLQQHRMVYETLGDNIENTAIHALSMKTFTPAQWEAAQKRRVL